MRCAYKKGVRKAGFDCTVPIMYTELLEYNEDGFLKKFNPLVTKIELYVLKFMLHGFTELDEKSSQYPRSQGFSAAPRERGWYNRSTVPC